MKKSIALARGKLDSEGERDMHTAKTLAGGGEQGDDQAIRRDSTTGEPLGEWGFYAKKDVSTTL